mgnify:CR=1 FL=1
MAKEEVQYCFTMFAALVMNHTYGNADTLGGMLTTVAIMKMLVLTVIDIPGTQRTILNFGT